MAIRGLTGLRYAPSAPFMIGSLKDPDGYVRANAAMAIADFGLQEAKESLLAMFRSETLPGAVEQAAFALGSLKVRSAAPEIRKKVPLSRGQTRDWLLQALGRLGSREDVPFVASYLAYSDNLEFSEAFAASQAFDELVGRPPLRAFNGPNIAGPRIDASRVWWNQHNREWPQRCGDCRSP